MKVKNLLVILTLFVIVFDCINVISAASDDTENNTADVESISSSNDDK